LLNQKYLVDCTLKTASLSALSGFQTFY